MMLLIPVEVEDEVTGKLHTKEALFDSSDITNARPVMLGGTEVGCEFVSMGEAFRTPYTVVEVAACLLASAEEEVNNQSNTGGFIGVTFSAT